MWTMGICDSNGKVYSCCEFSNPRRNWVPNHSTKFVSSWTLKKWKVVFATLGFWLVVNCGEGQIPVSY